MLFLSFTFARAVKLVMEVKAPRWLMLCSIAFFALDPVIAIMSIVPTKDVPFAAFLLLLTISVIRLLRYPDEYLSSWRHLLSLELLILACCLFRNNAVYAVALAIPFFVKAIRDDRARVLAAFLVPVLVFLVFSGPVQSALGIESIKKWEAFSVPMQQVVAVAAEHDGELFESGKKAIEEHLPYSKIMKNYNPRFADPVKNLFKADDKTGFMGIWFDLGRRYPKDYLAAALTLNMPYWYLPAKNIDPYSKREYIETGIYKSKYYGFERSSILPALYDAYEFVAADGITQAIGPLAFLLSISLPVWVLLGSACLIASVRGKRYALVVVIPMLYWATLMFAPVANFRYVFPIMCLYPLLLVAVLHPFGMFPER